MKTKVLMVCLGNICRSPLAQGILAGMVDPEKVLVDSAGTGNYHLGKPPDPRSIAVAKDHGIDISHQRCRQIQAGDLDRFDHIYVMDRSNYENVIRLCSTHDQRSKIRLLLDVLNTGNNEVPDPYYGGEKGFENIFSLITDACEKVAAHLNAK
ncbi:low molecular weight protein-tyrosine-phosphatase [Maribacter sp. 2307ULW6-5]|uniref:low molecular weight protein-tyrosine-phosphatase n=1 Tax=Maribacter sp. 2307ULW6-5 TaxID=3386275 RepID=UPI0039BD797B